MLTLVQETILDFYLSPTLVESWRKLCQKMLKLPKMPNKLFNNVFLNLFPSSLVKPVRNARQKNAKPSTVKTYCHQLISWASIATMSCWSYTWRNTGKLLSKIKKENKSKKKMKMMTPKETNHNKNDHGSNIYIMLNYLNKFKNDL